MLRRIGQFFKDIAETLKRERGKLQINSDPVAFQLKTGSLTSSNDDVSIKQSSSLSEGFRSIDIGNNTPPIHIKGKADYSHIPGVSSATTHFPFDLQTITEDSFYSPVKDCVCEIDDGPASRELPIDQFDQTTVIDGEQEDYQALEPNIKEPDVIDHYQWSLGQRDFQFHPVTVKDHPVEGITQVNDLETEFAQKQRAAFHFDNALDTNPAIDSYNPLFQVNCYHSLASAMRFPIKRYRVSKSGYETEELKRALSFIVKRYENTGRLRIVGIYKNVPIDNAERLTFTKDNGLFFYMKKRNLKRSLLMDVLVVKTKEGRYHVGPIIRKA